MKLYDKEKVLAGLAIFVLLITFPVFYNHGKSAPAPKIVKGEAVAAEGAPVLVLTDKAKEAKECVRDTAFMKAEHMQLINDWRDAVKRDGLRTYKVGEKEYDMSLSNTCLDCHSNKAEFCDRCHNYVSVSKYLFAGLHGHGALVPFMWTSLALMTIAIILLVPPATRNNETVLMVACICVFCGTWIDKGLGMISGGFVPNPLHHVNEYIPTIPELIITLGVYAVIDLIAFVRPSDDALS